TVIDTGAPLTAHFAAWCAAFAVFALAFHVGASAPEGRRTRRLLALAAQTPAMLAMAAILPCHFGALAVVIVASQAALVLSRAQVAGWIAVQTLVVGVSLSRVCPLYDTVAAMVALLGFQSFAAVAVFVVRGESEARRALAHANAELRATRVLLADASRAQERTRIARELHDVLGHDLTALGLQLEIASHVTPEQAPVHVGKARDVSARLLRNVREVVSAIRVPDGPGLAIALRTLVEDVPGLTVHLALPDELRVDEAARAHCVLRCVQEIVTNTLRHAHARNLWIAIAHDGAAITVDAHDDGRGATTVAAGAGLRGMQARIEELGGALRIAPAPSFALRAMLPLGAQP
ncbi:MAG: sensor histidine kinase, partial [Deltaproteobacteria bacterium]|nr:sensor histidine kinase [Deltaproteobacteria bacterium]